MKLILLISALILALTSPVLASCKSDCKDQFDSEVEECNLLNHDVADTNILKICMDEAKNECDSCIADCKDESGARQTSQ